MRVAGQTGGRLAGDEKFGELRMPLVKLNVVGRNSPNKIESFFIVLEFMSGETDQQFDIARLSDQFSFPFGIGEVVELFRFVFFLYQIRIPCAGNDHHISRQPGATFQALRISGGFRRQPVDNEFLINDLKHVLQGHLKDI